MRVVWIVALCLAPFLSPTWAGDAGEAPLKRRIRAIQEAESIVRAQVTVVHESPGVWCGGVASYQRVTYLVVERLAGDGLATGARTGVAHLLVLGSRLVDREEARLDPDLVTAGRFFLLALNRGEDGWVVRDEDYGALPLDCEWPNDPLAPLWQQLVDLPWLQPFLHPEHPSRRPLIMERSPYLLPGPVAVSAFGEPVRVLSRAEIEEQKISAYLTPTQIDLEEDRVTIHFAYAVEGLVGEASFAYREDAWEVTDTHGAER